MSMILNMCKKILPILLILVLVPVTAVYALTQVDDSINVYLNVNYCNQNSVCQPNIGEDSNNCPTDCTGGNTGGGGGGGGGSNPLTISNIESIVSTSSVTISWVSSELAYSTLSFGLTSSYELGAVVESVSALNHSVTIYGLTPGTEHLFKIEIVEDGNPNNKASSLGNAFTTLPYITDEPPANPTNFSAIYNAQSESVLLGWTNPPDNDFDVVRIVRSVGFFTSNPDEGLLIYEGSAEAFIDSLVEKDLTYYYTIFARDSGGNYSSGAIDFVSTTPGVGEDEEGNEEGDGEGEGEGEGEDENEEETDPTVDELLEKLPMSEEARAEFGNLTFSIRQDGNEQEFAHGLRIELDAQKETVLSIAYENLPEVLKTMMVTMRHPKDKSKVFAFILRVNDNKTAYTATIAPLIDPGEYEIAIYILDHKNSRLGKVAGAFIVEKSTGVLQLTQIPRALLPVGSAIGVASVLIQTILVTTRMKSLYDLYLIMARAFGALLGFLGLRRRHKPWGTVYDSVTKRPLDPAYVVVKRVQDDNQVAEAITDLDGRYGFFLPGGHYVIQAGKTHYEFPSKRLAKTDTDELYSNIYHGEQLFTTSGEVITRNIPLDPVGFDWNEFVKDKQTLYRLYSRREKVKSIIFDGLYLLGFIFTIISTILTPSLFNFIVLSFYLILFFVQTYWHTNYKAIRIYDHKSGEPYPYSIIRVFLSNLNQEVKRLVADEFGRFYLLVAPGRYYITIDAKQNDGSYRRVYRSLDLNLPKGVLNEDIKIDDDSVPLTQISHA